MQERQWGIPVALIHFKIMLRHVACVYHVVITTRNIIYVFYSKARMLIRFGNIGIVKFKPFTKP